ncbi:MAG: hypothetical protein ACXIUB_09295 [Wenzhouxiangella sp.]
MSKTSDWQPFPHPAEAFQFPGDALKNAWADLHRGDCEPFPDHHRVLALQPDNADPEATALTLQEAWRAFHAGNFGQAVELGLKAGDCGFSVANKACGIYADYLEEDEDQKIAIYQDGIARAEKAIRQFPDDPNAHYFHAFLLGRYSQCISITQALAQGVGGKIKASLTKALELAPEHAEAHTALGLYHAEIIDKVGKLVGSMTYGASADKAMTHFKKALKLTPAAPIAHLEYGNGLYLLFGDNRLDESNQAYADAAAFEPIDAMQMLDIDYARSSLDYDD